MPQPLDQLIEAGHPIIAIETTDEMRADEKVSQAANRLKRPLRTWSISEGLTESGHYRVEGDRVRSQRPVEAGKPDAALRHVIETRESAVYLFRDLVPHCQGRGGALIVRLLRDFVKGCNQLGATNEQTIVLVESGEIPPNVGRLVAHHDIGWPDEDELLEAVKQTYRRIKRQHDREIKAQLKKGEVDAIVRTLRGLSVNEAQRLIADVIYTDDSLTVDDIPRLVEGKRLLLKQSGTLETIAADVRPSEIGGMGYLMDWLAKREDAFSSEARAFGIEPPRGLLLLGVPGCGKSLCAKVIARTQHMPLLRLDPGTLYTKFIGESENQLRRALRQAESMAPCVLWIDEIEKAFASASSSSADGGLSKRMFGTLLSWMQDHRHPIFLVATANDISALPPELMRKGRFDEVFFVDLPDRQARRQILAIHLERRERDPQSFDLDMLAEASANFSGSELEQAVVSSLFEAYSAGETLADRHVLAAIEQTRPLAELAREKIAALREWAEDRCVPAG